MDILVKLFSSAPRIKIMRLFLLNKAVLFKSSDIAKKSMVTIKPVRQELKMLHSIDFIKQQKNGWVFNPAFKYLQEMENLLIGADTLDKEKLIKLIKKTGQIKLIIISGIFLKVKDSRADLFIVGDKVKKSLLEDVIQKIEAELGAEITYAIFDTKEFSYRLNMYDKLVRDILDFKKEILLMSKEFSTINLKKY